MKASNDLIKKFGIDKVIHGLVGMVILSLYVWLSLFLFGLSLISIVSGVVAGLVSTYFLARWKERKDGGFDKKGVKTATRGAFLVTAIALLAWIVVWFI